MRFVQCTIEVELLERSMMRLIWCPCPGTGDESPEQGRERGHEWQVQVQVKTLSMTMMCRAVSINRDTTHQNGGGLAPQDVVCVRFSTCVYF